MNLPYPKYTQVFFTICVYYLIKIIVTLILCKFVTQVIKLHKMLPKQTPRQNIKWLRNKMELIFLSATRRKFKNQLILIAKNHTTSGISHVSMIRVILPTISKSQSEAFHNSKIPIRFNYITAFFQFDAHPSRISMVIRSEYLT